MSVANIKFTEDSNSVSLVSVINGAIKLPGVKVDRNSFLNEQFRQVPPELRQQIINLGPVAAGCPRNDLWKRARQIVKERSILSSGTSFMAGLPGGFAMAATIPADLLQFYGVALRMAQEIAYLYGEEDLWLGGTPDQERVTNQLMIYCGTMLGATGASQAVKVMSSSLAKQALKKLPQKALTKTFYYPIVKSIAKFFGAKMTKDIFAKGVSKAVPVIGGVVSGGITMATMPPMGNRLIDALDEAHFSYTQEEFEKDWNNIVKNSDNSTIQDMEEVVSSTDSTDVNQYEDSTENKTTASNGEDTSDLLKKINQAKQLLDAGALTEEEFAEVKAKLIAQI